LYVVETDTNALTFIATLAANDGELWGESSFRTGNEYPKASDLTPDGRFLVFVSHEDLTADDTSTAGQVFEYEASSSGPGVLRRVSIGQDGSYNDDGNTYLFGKEPAFLDTGLVDPSDARLSELGAGYAEAYSGSAYGQALAVSEDGSYVVFESSDGLTPQALNHVQIKPFLGAESEERYGPQFAENVYEYHDGNVFLVSDGRDVSASLTGSSVNLIGMDGSGRDIFFETNDQLVPQDTDTQTDIYDARIDGGYPSPSTAGCEGDACQGQLAAAPTLLSPGSELQAGEPPPLAGGGKPNPPVISKPKAKAKPKKCKKNTKLKHGKCQKTKAKRASRNRKASS
jgi:hypothetical protein